MVAASAERLDVVEAGGHWVRPTQGGVDRFHAYPAGPTVSLIHHGTADGFVLNPIGAGASSIGGPSVSLESSPLASLADAAVGCRLGGVGLATVSAGQ